MVSLSKISVHDKISLAAGTGYWTFGALPKYEIEGIHVSDGPSGLRKQRKNATYMAKRGSSNATGFPCEAAMAASFDRELVGKIGKAIGEECRAQGCDMLLGPAVNIKRNPLGGRNFEYFSEDPYLTGTMAASYVNGLSEAHVMSCVKHFAGNNQETRRTKSNSVISERALHEIYLKAFAIITKLSEPAAFMAAYNRLNGRYCCENKWLLKDYLRGELKFDGIVMSDWGAIRRHVTSFNAGLDVEMPGGVNRHEDYLIEQAENGRFSEDRLNEIAGRVLALDEKAEKNRHMPYECDYDSHHDLAREAAVSSMILLTNKGCLPLSRDERILVVGDMAKHPRYQGSGSSRVNMLHMEPPWHFLKKEGQEVRYLKGYGITAPEEENEKLAKEAVSAAREYDKVVIFAGLPEQYESEGLDRDHLSLPSSQVKLIDRLCEANPDTVVVLTAGAPVIMPFKDKAGAILMAYLPGGAFGSAVTDILFGTENPSGKLSETFPAAHKHLPARDSFPSRENDAVYGEDVYVGYRHYEKEGHKPAFCFGHGLSYTSFAYETLRTEADGEGVTLSFTIENTGEREGREVWQLYVSSYKEPGYRTLAGYGKVRLAPKERAEVTVRLSLEDLAVYDTERKGWASGGGSYGFYIGASFSDIRLSKGLELTADFFRPLACEPVHVYEDLDSRVRPGLNSSLGDLDGSAAGRKILKILRKATANIKTDFVPEGRVFDLVVDTPVRQIPLGAGGRIRLATVRKTMALIGKITRSGKGVK